MAVVEMIEINAGREASVEYPEDGLVKKTYRRIFQVTTDDANDDASVILAYDGLPPFYSPYICPNGNDPDCLLKTITPTPNADYQYMWTVTCVYDNEPYLPTNTPLCQPPIWTVSFTRQKEPVEADIYGNAVLNSARIPIALERETSVMQLQIKWSSINFSYVDIASLQDTLNGAAWNGFPAGVLKLDGLQITQQIDTYRAGLGLGNPPGNYYEKTITLACKWDGWQAQLLDAGLYQLGKKMIPGKPPRWQPCRDTNGQPVQMPVPLNGFGQQLPFGQRPVWLTFDIYRQADWTNLIDWPTITCPER